MGWEFSFPPTPPPNPPHNNDMDVTFDATFLSDLINDAKGLFGAFSEYVFLLISILIAFQFAHFVIAMITKPPRRPRRNIKKYVFNNRITSRRGCNYNG